MSELLKYLTIDGVILRHPKLHGDNTTKLILSYIIFKLNHPTTIWVFSQINISKDLDIPKSTIFDKCKKLQKMGILSFGKPIKTHAYSYTPISVNIKVLETFLLEEGGSAIGRPSSAIGRPSSATELPHPAIGSSTTILEESILEQVSYKNDTPGTLVENPQTELGKDLPKSTPDKINGENKLGQEFDKIFSPPSAGEARNDSPNGEMNKMASAASADGPNVPDPIDEEERKKIELQRIKIAVALEQSSLEMAWKKAKGKKLL